MKLREILPVGLVLPHLGAYSLFLFGLIFRITELGLVYYLVLFANFLLIPISLIFWLGMVIWSIKIKDSHFTNRLGMYTLFLVSLVVTWFCMAATFDMAGKIEKNERLIYDFVSISSFIFSYISGIMLLLTTKLSLIAINK